MADDAFASARIHAMAGRLLSRIQYEFLLSQGTLDGLVEALKGSPYGPMLERTIVATDLARPFPAIIRMDGALRQDLVESLGRLQRFFSDRSLELMHTLLLRWDVYNLKTVMRAKRAAGPLEEVLATTFPVGILDEVALVELARLPTLHAVAGTLEVWRLPFARAVRTGLNLLGKSESLHALEFELDRFAAAQTARLAADGDENTLAVRRYLRLLVDKANLLTGLRYLAERSVRSPMEAGRWFLQGGGRLTRSHYDAVVGARDVREGLSRLAGTPYGWLAGTRAEGEPISLPLVERQVDRMIIRRAVSLSRCDPLGIGVAVAYLERKTDEIRNIRMMLRGKALGMGVARIAEWVTV